MIVGLIVDGESEYKALPSLSPRLRTECDLAGLIVLRAPIPPYAPPGTILRACKDRIVQLDERGADLVLILVDREQRQECCGDLAAQIEKAGLGICSAPVRVVIKDRTFENWIVADTKALERQAARFKLTNSFRNTVSPNKADTANALELLQRVTQGSGYSKVKDAINTLKLAQPKAMGTNSRSFRRFLRCLGHPDYESQSRLPA